MNAESILAWWEAHRDTIAKHEPSAVAAIDNDANRLTTLLRRSEQIVVCTLGQAAVGKSTLLNALAAGSQTVLPAGGIGPLTALATRLCYSAEPYFSVRYQEAKRLHGVRVSLERELGRQGRGVALAVASDPDAATVESLL